ncbi:hypothetical protein [Thermotoga sp.]|uniref:hypothetical protein n=1 Tax=Thermotoga sp. TaxID=28240 RepID=UPI002600CCF5|nr:hypothetical protein [Thermotoga sp.]
MIIGVSKEDAEFVLEKDESAVRVISLPDEVRKDRIYVTEDPEIAKKLKERGALRVLLVE